MRSEPPPPPPLEVRNYPPKPSTSTAANLTLSYVIHEGGDYLGLALHEIVMLRYDTETKTFDAVLKNGHSFSIAYDGGLNEAACKELFSAWQRATQVNFLEPV